jgi:NADH-quinone oxidoreductase subunit A
MSRQGVEALAAAVYMLLCAATGVSMLLILHLARRLPGAGRGGRTERAPYECGVPLLGGARERFGARFYLVGLMFVLFDVELVFLLPYAVAFKRLGTEGVFGVLVFVAVLAVGLVYLYLRGVLDWEHP